MKKSFRILGLTSATALALSLSAYAQTTTYNGNGATGFGGPFGNGMLTFSSDGTTLSGTLTPGNNSGTPTGSGQIYDEAVIYIDSQAGGFTDTSTLTAAQTNGNVDFLQQAAAGTNGTLRSTVDFAPGFGADYVLALSPTQAQFGALYAITSTGGLNFVQSVNITPVGAAGPYTFSFALANIGSPTSFNFSTTYLNAHITTPNGVTTNNLFRSNEAIGNTVTDVTAPTNTGNPGQDTVSLGVNVFGTPIGVPEPGTWAMMILGGCGSLVGLRRRLRQTA